MKKTRTICKSRNYASRRCPTCGSTSLRKGIGTRKIKDISLEGPLIYEVTYSKHYCPRCKKYFISSMDDLVAKGNHFSLRTKRMVLNRLHEDNMNVKHIQRQILRDFNVTIPIQTIYRWDNERFS